MPSVACYRARDVRFLDEAWGGRDWVPPAEFKSKASPCLANHPDGIIIGNNAVGNMKRFTLAATKMGITPTVSMWARPHGIFLRAMERKNPREPSFYFRMPLDAITLLRSTHNDHHEDKKPDIHHLDARPRRRQENTRPATKNASDSTTSKQNVSKSIQTITAEIARARRASEAAKARCRLEKDRCARFETLIREMHDSLAQLAANRPPDDSAGIYLILQQQIRDGVLKELCNNLADSKRKLDGLEKDLKARRSHLHDLRGFVSKLTSL